MAVTSETAALFCCLLEKYIEQEWHNVLAEKGEKFTRIPRNSIEIEPENTKLFNRIKVLAPIVNYLAPQETWLKGAVATKFDVLAFSKFYGSLVYGILLEDWFGKAADCRFWMRNCRVNTCHRSSFSLNRVSNLIDGELDDTKLSKIGNIRNSLRELFESIRKYQLGTLNKGLDLSKRWHANFKLHSTLSSLPNQEKCIFDALISVVANLLVSIFDDRARLAKAQSIVGKIPVTFISTSLYIINPAPFIAKALHLFMWQPSPNVYSLCQRLAGSLCAFSSTKQRLNDARESISTEIANQIDTVLLHTKISSLAESELFTQTLEQNNIPISDRNLAYFRLLARFEEKRDFVEHFTGTGDTAFIDYMGTVLPTLLDELAKVQVTNKAGSLSKLVSNFFSMLTSILNSMESYLDSNQTVDVVPEIVDHIYEFMEFFYPYLHYMGKVHGTANELKIFTAVMDFIFGVVLQLENDGAFRQCDDIQSNGYHADIMAIVANMPESEKSRLWEDISQIQRLCESGIDDRVWPACKEFKYFKARMDQQLQ